MQINKVLQTPALPCESNSFYFVKKPNNKVDCFVSNDAGDQQYQIFNAEDLPSVDGPIVAVMGSTVEYIITDFDYQANYLVTVSAGDFDRADDVISFTAPVTEGTVQLTINRTVVNITVTNENTAPYLNKEQKGYINPIYGFYATQYYREFNLDTIQLPNGKMLVMLLNDALDYPPSLRNNPIVTRLNNDGSIDRTFGDYGCTTIPDSYPVVYHGKLITDTNGLIYVVVFQEPGEKIQVYKLNVDGSLDNGFGVVDIYGPQGPVNGLTIYGVNSITQNDGKLLVRIYSGDWYNNLFNTHIARINTNGTLDTTFGVNGYFTYHNTDVFGTENLRFNSRILLGYLNTGIYFYALSATNEVQLVKLTMNGVIDASFGINGKLLLLSAAVYPNITYSDLKETPDSKFLLVKTEFNSVSDYASYHIEKRDEAGLLDTTFATNGVFTRYLPLWRLRSSQLKVFPDGKILVLEIRKHSYQTDVYTVRLFRLSADGTLDTAFGVNGEFVIPFTFNYNPYTVFSIDADNKIVISSSNDDEYIIPQTKYLNENTIIRLNSNGTWDTTFGNTSSGLPPVFLNYAVNSNVVLFPDIIVSDLELSSLNSGAGNFNGASFVLNRTANGIAAPDADDQFTFINNVTTEGNVVKVNGEPVATFTNTLGTLTVIFNSNTVTTDAADTVLRNISYKYNGAIDPDLISWLITLAFSDGNTGAQGIGGAAEVIAEINVGYEYGVVLSTYCVLESITGTEKWAKISLGNAESYSVLLDAYSVDCGFDPLLIDDPFTESVKTNLYDHINPVGSPWRQGDWGLNTSNPDTLKLEISSPGYVTVLEYVDGDVEGTDVPFSSIQNSKCVAWIDQLLPVYNYSIEANVEILSDANDSYVSLIGRIQNGPGSNTGDYVDVNWWPSPSWSPGTSAINESTWGSGILSQDVTSFNETFTGIHLFRVDFINDQCKIYIDNVLKSTITIDTSIILPNVGGYVGLGITAKTTNFDGPGIKVLDFKVTALF